jgi:RimJ/RimL family protein N-acetyltransferase
MSEQIKKIFPLFQLKIKSEQLELRFPNEEELGELAALAFGNILPEEKSHFFATDWSQNTDDFQLKFVQRYWQVYSEWSVESWKFPGVVFFKNKPIGVMEIASINDFRKTRSVITGSWLLKEYQGQGFGRQARAIALSFVFNELQGEICRSAAHKDNRPSNGVSSSLGYQLDGTESVHGVDDMVRYKLTKENWLDDLSVQVEGFEICKQMFFGSSE